MVRAEGKRRKRETCGTDKRQGKKKEQEKEGMGEAQEK